jgi:RNA polymerase sigma factor (sigma-70 family)
LLRAQSDHRLLELARDGHERAFEALVRRYHKPLLAYGRRLLPAAMAEDAVQQSLLQAWQALQRGTEVRELAPWLHRIVYHSAIRMQRPRGDDRAPVTPASTADPPHAELERRMAARDALAGVAALPALQREALLQTALEGRTHEQVAETLGVTDGAVRGLLYRARTTLRAAATALTPVPIAGWAVHGDGGRHSSGKQLASSLSDAGGLSDVGGRAGGAGLAAVLGKGGAIAISAGVLVAGTAAMHHGLWRVHVGAGAGAGTAGHPGARAASLPGVTASGAGLQVGSTFVGARAAVAASAARASTRVIAGSVVGSIGGAGSTAQAGGSVRILVGGGAAASSRKDRPARAAGRGARPTTAALVGPGSPIPAAGSATSNTAGATNATAHPSGSGNARSSATGNAGSGAAASAAASTSGRSSASTAGSNGDENTSTAAGAGSTATGGVPKSSDNTDEGNGGATATPGGATGAASGGSGNGNTSGGSASAAPGKTAGGADD